MQIQHSKDAAPLWDLGLKSSLLTNDFFGNREQSIVGLTLKRSTINETNKLSVSNSKNLLDIVKSWGIYLKINLLIQRIFLNIVSNIVTKNLVTFYITKYFFT